MGELAKMAVYQILIFPLCRVLVFSPCMISQVVFLCLGHKLQSGLHGLGHEPHLWLSSVRCLAYIPGLFHIAFVLY